MNQFNRTIIVGAVSIAAIHTAPAQQQPSKPGLQHLLEAELARFPGRAGIWVKHLTLGEEAAVHADDAFNSASVIKLPVLVLAMQMAERGELSLAERVTINAKDFRGGTGVFHYNDPGLQPTLHDVLLQMIITSDNTATDIAIKKVGGVDRVNAWLQQNNYADVLKLNMTLEEMFAKYSALPTGANRNEKTNADRGYWLGAMTPRATGRLLESIERCSDGTAPPPPVASQKTCADMIRMLRARRAGARRLPHYLSVPVSPQDRRLSRQLPANDVGIIFTRSGPVVVSFFSNAIEGPFAEAEDRIGRIAQLIVAYFDGAQ